MKRSVLIAFVAIVVLGALRSAAYAYPQFELSKDQSCAGCHISPTGGGLLSENGMAVAESISKFGTAPEFMYGSVKTPQWLTLGGDFRGASGYLQTPHPYLVSFPMQADLYANAQKNAFTLQVTLGYRPPEEGNEAATTLWSREHYIGWQSKPGEREGLFVRAGRFMPVFGLRFAEHPIYTRRFGGTPLYSETYGVMGSYVNDKIEAHLSGFVKDPFIDVVRHSNGAAAYGEYRVAKFTLVGAGAMLDVTDISTTVRATVTAKHYLPGPDVLLQGELQDVNPHVAGYGFIQIAGYLMGTWFGPAGTMVDLGYGHFDENTRMKGLDRDCFDLNLHWFVTSHLEAVINNRVELIGKGQGGPTGAYSLLMAHYRL